jgi:hypothetical protein
MAIKLFKHRWQNITLIVLSVLTIIALLGALLLNSILTPILSKKLKSAILKGTDSLYHVDFSKAELHIFRGKAVLYHITLKPDTAVYRKMKQRGTAPNNIFDIKIKRLLIDDAQPLKLFLNKKLDIGSITLNNPHIQLSKYPNKSPGTTSKDERTLYQKISRSLKLVHVGKIILNDINLIYKDNTGKVPAVSALKRMELKATDLLIDSATQTDSSRTLFCKNITTTLHNFSGTSAKGLYSYKVKFVTLSTQTARLKVTGINLQPLDPKSFFAKTRADRFAFRMDSLILNGFDFNTWFKQQILNVSRITMSNGAIGVYSNPNPPLYSSDRLITFPHYMLRNLKLHLNVDTLNVKGITVSYKQYNKKAKKAGMVWFTKTAGRFLNITNQKAKLIKNNICTANLTTYIMSKGKLDASFTFNLSNPDYSYSYTGHLGPMDMRAANIAAMPLGAVEITSGRATSLDFNIHSTQKTSTGTVKFLYQDGKISMLKDKSGKEYSKKPLLSFLANTFVVKHDNPDDGSTTPRIAKVIFVRPANFPFFETMWLTLLKGIKACAGVGKAEKKTC